MMVRFLLLRTTGLTFWLCFSSTCVLLKLPSWPGSLGSPQQEPPWSDKGLRSSDWPPPEGLPEPWLLWLREATAVRNVNLVSSRAQAGVGVTLIPPWTEEPKWNPWLRGPVLMLMRPALVLLVRVSTGLTGLQLWAVWMKSSSEELLRVLDGGWKYDEQADNSRPENSC